MTATSNWSLKVGTWDFLAPSVVTTEVLLLADEEVFLFINGLLLYFGAESIWILDGEEGCMSESSFLWKRVVGREHRAFLLSPSASIVLSLPELTLVEFMLWKWERFLRGSAFEPSVIPTSLVEANCWGD